MYYKISRASIIRNICVIPVVAAILIIKDLGDPITAPTLYAISNWISRYGYFVPGVVIPCFIMLKLCPGPRKKLRLTEESVSLTGLVRIKDD